MRLTSIPLFLAVAVVAVGCGGGSVPTPSEGAPLLLIAEDTSLILRSPNGADSHILATSNGAHWSALSMDGRRVAVPTPTSGTTVEVKVIEVANGVTTTTIPDVPIGSLAFSPSGESFASVAQQDLSSRIQVVDVATQRKTTWGPVVTNLQSDLGLSWDPKGRYIAAVQGPDSHVVLVEQGTSTTPIAVVDGDSPSFSRDGSQLAYATPEGNLAIYNLRSKATQTYSAVDKIQGVKFGVDNETIFVDTIRPNGPSESIAWVASMKIGTGTLDYIPSTTSLPQVLVGVGPR